MEENYRRYPIGIQNFEQLRNRNCVYVDKTELVYRLANTDSVYFLSRPRRFGKSLLVSTLEAYFQGKKDLFKGLAMERLEKDWNVYPVFHIDFSLTKYTTLFDLQEQLNLFLLRCEKVYGAEKEEKTPAARLQGMIRRAYEQTGLPVVVLIDEYDVPMAKAHENGYYDEMVLLLRNMFGNVPTSPCSRSFGMNCVSFSVLSRDWGNTFVSSLSRESASSAR